MDQVLAFHARKLGSNPSPNVLKSTLHKAAGRISGVSSISLYMNRLN